MCNLRYEVFREYTRNEEGGGPAASGVLMSRVDLLKYHISPTNLKMKSTAYLPLTLQRKMLL